MGVGRSVSDRMGPQTGPEEEMLLQEKSYAGQVLFDDSIVRRSIKC
jgi:hypothetical protein